MTTMTIAPANNQHGEHPDYYLGRADAYDDSATRTVDQMVVLMGMAVDYASIPYARGYSDRVTELRLELDVVAGAESELAQTGLARKQATWARPDLLGDLLGDDITETITVPDQAITRATASASDTQPLSRNQIAAGLTASADTETPKEHPQP